jgi:hypothetical protein
MLWSLNLGACYFRPNEGKIAGRTVREDVTTKAEGEEKQFKMLYC